MCVGDNLLKRVTEEILQIHFFWDGHFDLYIILKVGTIYKSVNFKTYSLVKIQCWSDNSISF